MRTNGYVVPVIPRHFPVAGGQSTWRIWQAPADCYAPPRLSLRGAFETPNRRRDLRPCNRSLHRSCHECFNEAKASGPRYWTTRQHQHCDNGNLSWTSRTQRVESCSYIYISPVRAFGDPIAGGTPKEPGGAPEPKAASSSIASPQAQSEQASSTENLLRVLPGLTKPVKIKIAYGVKALLPAGMKLSLKSADASILKVVNISEKNRRFRRTAHRLKRHQQRVRSRPWESRRKQTRCASHRSRMRALSVSRHMKSEPQTVRSIDGSWIGISIVVIFSDKNGC